MKITKNTIAAPIDLTGKAGAGETSIFNSSSSSSREIFVISIHPSMKLINVCLGPRVPLNSLLVRDSALGSLG